LGSDEVESIVVWERKDAEGWDDVLGREEARAWLVY
jgi:hypothetical protein